MLPESMRCAQGIPCDVSSRRGMGAAAARRAFIDDSVMSVSSDSDGQDDLVLVEDQQSPAGFMEIFSPPRVALHVVPRGMTSGGSFDIITGCDILTWYGREQVLRALTASKPLFLVSSPPCTMYSELMRVWNLKKMKASTRRQRQKDAQIMLDFSMNVCELQGRAGRFWVHEHPVRASSWKQKTVPELTQTLLVGACCVYGFANLGVLNFLIF